MSRSRIPERGFALVAGLLLLLCGTLFAASPSSASSASAGADAPPRAASVSAPSSASSYEEPGTGDTAPDAPGCHKQKKGDVDGAVPAPTSGAQNLALVLSACLVPESHAAIGTAHARPPARGPTPAQPPTPVELSVLRV
ncbi:hypothetical protein [Streptomyces sp. NPDC048172]|uniref:hypothetical protein n=1 Tax=Streptomyces sp. NPDC048172 TaxID=3365505 RepID=UPI00371D09F9